MENLTNEEKEVMLLLFVEKILKLKKHQRKLGTTVHEILKHDEINKEIDSLINIKNKIIQ